MHKLPLQEVSSSEIQRASRVLEHCKLELTVLFDIHMVNLANSVLLSQDEAEVLEAHKKFQLTRDLYFTIMSTIDNPTMLRSE